MTQMKYISLDVHKETVAVAIAEATRGGEVRFYGTIPNTPEAIRRLFDRLSGSGADLHFATRLADAGTEFTGSFSNWAHSAMSSPHG